ncbi:MocR-like pyridoxine biosynthesis transcription factor PdxR [Paenibacillus dakarensis]|uniref:MocR-like pyridoxine biosynthesis transcription factor PdxR n=1 Tax=Paenibacillus dakarensis TaxID=1527293 RepID=UPI0006D57C03|nr:PLP-dependent aminotransferase family protein [Paenibacillus dakarensis]
MELGLSLEAYLEKYRYKYLALYHALRDAILAGILPGGTRLPATRELARLYEMSRGSAAQSYDMLLAEGYVVTMTGSGTYVAMGISLLEQAHEEHDCEPVLSIWGQRMTEWMLSHGGSFNLGHEQPMEDRELISFIGDRAESAHFPFAEWKSSIHYAAGHPRHQSQLELPSAGNPELRQAIAGHLKFTRGIQADPEHIVIFSGSMQGIMLLSQLLISPGDPVVIENPGYHGIRHAVLSCDGRIVPAQVDSAGLIPERWDSRLLFVTPSRQYPTGAVLSMERRRELLNWANIHKAIIIEDDYDSEFRFGGRPMEPLKALDDTGRVIYIGSFSKTMFPGLRLGYAVLPKMLVKPVVSAKALYEPVSPALLEQRALAHFMARGGYGRHLRRMTRIYKGLHSRLGKLMEAKLSHLFRMNPGDAGLHVYAEWLHGPETYDIFKKACRNRGVEFRDAALYHLSMGTPAACFTFSHLDQDQLESGITRMALAWKDMQNG